MDHYKQPKGQVGKGIKTFQCRNPTCLQDFFFCCAIFSQAQPLARFFFLWGGKSHLCLFLLVSPLKSGLSGDLSKFKDWKMLKTVISHLISLLVMDRTLPNI